MAFIRFIGCSVGKRICQHCDTDFDQRLPWRGGGDYSAVELLNWASPYTHICLTGGEPLDQELDELVRAGQLFNIRFHIETSGTKMLNNWLHALRPALWVCVSPKPGFIEDVVTNADEIKVIVPGLGEITPALLNTQVLKNRGGGVMVNPLQSSDAEWREAAQQLRWPTLEDALRWADMGKIVYLQPRNGKFDIDAQNLRYVQDLLVDHPNLRLSLQMHKLLKVQ